MTNLVIVESPAKCQKIQGFLGPGWKVIASMGHIRALEHSLEAIGLDRDFDAKYEFIKEKAKAIKQLKESAKDASEIYLAADADREGENIAYSVCLLLKLNPKVAKRAVFNEITEKAIKNAVNNPRTLDMNLVNAQQSRAILDMMIGFTMSPLLWRYVAPGLSAGRCQTPALRLVVEKEDSIINFKSTSSCQLSIEWKAKSFKFPAQMIDELEDEESAVNYMENIHTTTEGFVIDKKISDWSEKAPLPLITSTLQQQASAIYHINPKQTMRIAQKLYEAGHITYMRTDKAVMSEEATEECKTWVKNTYGDEYISQYTRKADISEKSKKSKEKSADSKSTQDKVKAQEAHECIRPTHINIKDVPGEWTGQEKKIYNLIWQRAVQSVMTAARGETCKIYTQIKDDDDFTWVSQWKRTLFEGWKIIGKVAKIEREDDDDDENNETTKDGWNQVSTIEIGTSLQWTYIKAQPKETKASPRFTEATLVRELEKNGIGRPSTYASLLSTIQEKEYVEIKDIPARDIKVKEYTLKPNIWPCESIEFTKKVGAEKGKLVPTNLGRSVLEFTLKHFDDLFNYNFTANMEKRLDSIAEGKEHWKDSLRDMWESYKDRYTELSSKQSLKGKISDGNNARVKEFSGGIKAVISKKGPLLLIEGATKEETIFLGWPSNISFQDITEEQVLQFRDQFELTKKKAAIGMWNDKEIIKKSGKFGDYLQCGDVSVTYIADESLEATIQRFEAKSGSAEKNLLKKFKEYEIKNGQYGPYIIKTSLKKIQFVSVPKNTDIDSLTEKDVATLYKDGLEKKKNAKKFYGKKKDA